MSIVYRGLCIETPPMGWRLALLLPFATDAGFLEKITIFLSRFGAEDELHDLYLLRLPSVRQRSYEMLERAHRMKGDVSSKYPQ